MPSGYLYPRAKTHFFIDDVHAKDTQGVELLESSGATIKAKVAFGHPKKNLVILEENWSSQKKIGPPIRNLVILEQTWSF